VKYSQKVNLMKVAVFKTTLVLILYAGSPAAVCVAHQQPDNQTQPSEQTSPSAPPQSEPSQQEPPKPQEAPPAEAPQPQAPPEQAPRTPPQQTPSPQETSPPASSKEASPSTKPKPIRKKRKPVTNRQASGQSGKVVVRNGGASDHPSQISPGMNDQQAQHQRDTVNQLLATTDANLKKISGRQLTSAQQSMLDQINTYVRQSKAASDTGDLSRAHTLAFKAHLLSDDLARK
jgi:outer membrane biosynthesis protein TonB